jgi:hypothetical protein
VELNECCLLGTISFAESLGLFQNLAEYNHNYFRGTAYLAKNEAFYQSIPTKT